MKKKQLLACALAVAIGGLVMTGMASADTTVIHNPDAGITYTLNAGYPTEQNFTAGTITITDGTTTITMLDRNLGATAAGTGCKGNGCLADDATYGYHFQWGNNYGFDPNSTPSTSSNQVSATSLNYNPLQQQYFSSNTFIIGNQNWLNDSSVVDLWGGSVDDYIDGIDGTNWQVNNATARQGPCPKGFHVPSYGELSKIRVMVDESALPNELLIPFASIRDYNGGSVWIYGYDFGLRSSSPYFEDDSAIMLFYDGEEGGITSDHFFYADAGSLRCVYDSYETYTPAGNLSSEGGDSEIIVNIAALNGGQNTCSGEDFIFPAITASPVVQTIKLAKKFQCIFGNAANKAVNIHLSGDLTDGNGNVIPGANVKLSNPEWTSTPTGLKNGTTAFSGQTFMGGGKTLFNKVENMIGEAQGSGVQIEITVPAGTPDGTYQGTIILDF